MHISLHICEEQSYSRKRCSIWSAAAAIFSGISPSIGTPNKKCPVMWNKKHLVLHSLYDKSCGWWLWEMFAFKARAYINNMDVIILFSYGCIQHWNLWIRDTIYMVIYGMSFPVRMFYWIILHPSISSVWSVTLYWVTIYLLHNCCLLTTPVNTNLNIRNATRPAFFLHILKSQWTNTYIKKLQEKTWMYYIIQGEACTVLTFIYLMLHEIFVLFINTKDGTAGFF